MRSRHLHYRPICRVKSNVFPSICSRGPDETVRVNILNCQGSMYAARDMGRRNQWLGGPISSLLRQHCFTLGYTVILAIWCGVMLSYCPILSHCYYSRSHYTFVSATSLHSHSNLLSTILLALFWFFDTGVFYFRVNVSLAFIRCFFFFFVLSMHWRLLFSCLLWPWLIFYFYFSIDCARLLSLSPCLIVVLCHFSVLSFFFFLSALLTTTPLIPTVFLSIVCLVQGDGRSYVPSFSTSIGSTPVDDFFRYSYCFYLPAAGIY